MSKWIGVVDNLNILWLTERCFAQGLRPTFGRD